MAALKSMKRDYALYQVALKLLLRKGRKIIFLRLADSSRWDLPGGRLDEGEENVPLNDILAREIREELGPMLRYKLLRPAFQFRRYVPRRGVYNLLTVYEGRYRSGAIRLSTEHQSCQWLDPRKHNFSAKDFLNKEEYAAFKKYFKWR